MNTVIELNGNGASMFSSFPTTTRTNKGKSLLAEVSDYVSIDIETTGFSPTFDEIIELGAVKYRNGVEVDTFSSLVNPYVLIDDFVSQMTGITNEMLASAPPLEEVLPKYIDFLGDDILVGHNIHFDVNFIYDACENLNLPPFDNDFIDTMRLAKRMYKELNNHKLDTLINFFSLPPRTLHRGLGDCELTAKCYQKMLEDEHRFNEAIKETHSHRCALKDLVAVGGKENPDSPLYGKVCVFTGALESFSRKEAAQIVVNIGGICADSITKKSNFLILGNNDYCKSIKDGKSAKQKKAEKLIAEGADLIIIPESVFLDILQLDCSDTQQASPQSDVIAESSTMSLEEKEEHAFSLISPTLKECLEQDNLSSDALFFRKSKSSKAQYSSVYFFNESNLFCRISFRGSRGYFSIPSKYAHLIPDGVEHQKQNSESNYVRIWIDTPEEIAKHLNLLVSLLDALIDAFPADFGCCSRYVACSDAKRCINPDSDMSIRCY